jgi:hypothetical protein
MTTDTERNLSPLKSTIEAVQREPSAADIARTRLRQLDAAVQRGDISSEVARDLRHGYESIQARDRAGLPPLDLTY